MENILNQEDWDIQNEDLLIQMAENLAKNTFKLNIYQIVDLRKILHKTTFRFLLEDFTKKILVKNIDKSMNSESKASLSKKNFSSEENGNYFCYDNSSI